jgi:hypothetical protein
MRLENTGTRINDTRASEALGDAVIATACPCRIVMLGDAVNAKKAAGQARDNVEVIDIASLLARSAKHRESTAWATGTEAPFQVMNRPPGPRCRAAGRCEPRPCPRHAHGQGALLLVTIKSIE